MTGAQLIVTYGAAGWYLLGVILMGASLWFVAARVVPDFWCRIFLGVYLLNSLISAGASLLETLP